MRIPSIFFLGCLLATGGVLAEPLHDAVITGNINEAKHLARPNNVNTPDREGLTPLFLAVGMGSLEMVRVLINAKATVNKTVKSPQFDKWSPLHMAAAAGDEAIAQALVDAGANKKMRNSEGQQPVDLASTEELVGLLSK